MTYVFIALAFIFLKFFIDLINQSNDVNKQGGMKKKYEELIQILMSENPRIKIFQETSTSLVLGISNMAGSTIFEITQSFGKVNIQWKVNNPIYGNHKIEWDFDENYDQEKMALKIYNDTANYSENLINTFGY